MSPLPRKKGQKDIKESQPNKPFTITEHMGLSRSFLSSIFLCTSYRLHDVHLKSEGYSVHLELMPPFWHACSLSGLSEDNEEGTGIGQISCQTQYLILLSLKFLCLSISLSLCPNISIRKPSCPWRRIALMEQSYLSWSVPLAPCCSCFVSFLMSEDRDCSLELLAQL